MRLQTAHDATDSQFLVAFCFSTDNVGDAVYVMGPKVGDHYQVTASNIDDVATAPSVGIIIEKQSPTECVVQTTGIVYGVYAGLTPNKPLFIGTTSQLTETVPPHKPTPGRRTLQLMGQAISATELLLSVRSPILLVT